MNKRIADPISNIKILTERFSKLGYEAPTLQGNLILVLDLQKIT